MFPVAHRSTLLETAQVSEPLRDAFELLCAQQCGIIAEAHNHRFHIGRESFWMATMRLSRFPAGAFFSAEENAGGYSVNRGVTTLRAVGEAIERYSAITEPPPRERKTFKIGESPFFGVLPRTAQSESNPQYALSDETQRVTHTAMRRVADPSRQEWIPSDHIHLSHDWQDGDQIATHISTGHAFHMTRELSLASGLRECLERDALMISWRCQRTSGRIDTASLVDTSPNFRRTLAFTEGLAERVEFYDIDVGLGLPIVLALVYAEEAPFVSAGCSAANDGEEALLRALEEACAFHLSAFVTDKDLIESPLDIQNIQDHSDFYALNRVPEAFEFLKKSKTVSFDEWSASRTTSVPMDPEGQRVFAAKLEEEGLTWLYHDVPLCAEELPGFVTKSFVPECVPLSSAFSARWLGTPRLLEKQREYGCEHLNPYPHPFG